MDRILGRLVAIGLIGGGTGLLALAILLCLMAILTAVGIKVL